MFGCHLYISVDVGINGTLATMGMLSVRWSCWFMLLNCAQYNGKYGCTTCKHKGQEVRIFTHAYIHIMWCTGCACWITFQVKVGRGTARAYGFEQLVLRERECNTFNWGTYSWEQQKSMSDNSSCRHTLTAYSLCFQHACRLCLVSRESQCFMVCHT